MCQDVAPTNMDVEKVGTTRATGQGSVLLDLVGFFLLSQQRFWSFCIEFLSLSVLSDSAKYQICLEDLKEGCKGSSPGLLLLVCFEVLKMGNRRVSRRGEMV